MHPFYFNSKKGNWNCIRWEWEGQRVPCSDCQWCAGITELWSLCSPACAWGQHNCRDLWQIQVGQLQGWLRDTRITGGVPGNQLANWTCQSCHSMECQENTALVKPSTCNPVCGSDRGPGISNSGSGSCGAGNSGLLWALPAALLSSVVISQAGLAPSRCVHAQQGVGLVWQQAGWCGWLQAGQHQPAARTALHVQPHPKDGGMFPLYPPEAKGNSPAFDWSWLGCVSLCWETAEQSGIFRVCGEDAEESALPWPLVNAAQVGIPVWIRSVLAGVLRGNWKVALLTLKVQ